MLAEPQPLPARIRRQHCPGLGSRASPPMASAAASRDPAESMVVNRLPASGRALSAQKDAHPDLPMSDMPGDFHSLVLFGHRGPPRSGAIRATTTGGALAPRLTLDHGGPHVSASCASLPPASFRAVMTMIRWSAGSPGSRCARKWSRLTNRPPVAAAWRPFAENPLPALRFTDRRFVLTTRRVMTVAG